MRAATIVLMGYLVGIIGAKLSSSDACDPALITKAEEKCNSKIDAVRLRFEEEISIIRSTIEDWKQRIASNDPDCARERFNCEALLLGEETSLVNTERAFKHEIAELQAARELEVEQIRRECSHGSKSATPTPKASAVKCQGGRCSCGAGKRLASRTDLKPIHDGCSVPGFLNADSFNSLFYNDFLRKWHDSACKVHDLCYAGCTHTQSDCDNKFRSDLRADCDAMVSELNVAEVLCPWLCEHEEEARIFFGDSPRDPEKVCKNYVSRKSCQGRYSMAEMKRYVLEDCRRIAGLFTMGVSMFGGGAFAESQRNHCECVPATGRDREL